LGAGQDATRFMNHRQSRGRAPIAQPNISWLARLGESPWLWLTPVLVPFVLFLLLPVVEVVRLSFHQWDWHEWIPVGLAQYRRLLRDPEFFRAVAHTFTFALVVVPTWVVLTLTIASLIAPLHARARARWTTAFYLTYLVSPVVLAMVWTWMLAPDAGGLINRGLGFLGFEPLPWLVSPRLALSGVILSTALTIPGSGVLLYGAAISALPRELYEAAQLEGATRFSQWRRITVPLLRPTTLYLSVIYTIASFQVFERVYIMTGGGPAGATTVLVERIYTDAFLGFDFGAASAQAVVLLVLIAAVSSIQFRALAGETQY
jgi:multiple sugar transport system permease protein